jgi:hypothetical protein
MIEINRQNDASTPLKPIHNINSLLTPAFQIYKHIMMFSSTPNVIPKPLRKPKINFHSIDDIVNGGKSKFNIFCCD